MSDNSRSACSLVALSILLLTSSSAYAADTINSAWALYSHMQYKASAEAFERLLKAPKPTARLYYCAALANRDSGNATRAKQLFEYIVRHYPGTTEAAYAQKLMGGAVAPDVQLPDIIKNSLPKEMQDLLNSEAGKAVVRQTMKDQAKNIDIVSKAEKDGKFTKDKATAITSSLPLHEAVVTTKASDKAPKNANDQPFTAADIKRDGAHGIDQSRYPNCWFEASMSGLAELPRGQSLIASMIHYAPNGGYIVRFPNDGTEYRVSAEALRDSDVQDKSLWASILECAETQKFPDNVGANGSNSDQSRLDVGLGCITGKKAELLHPEDTTIAEMSSFIGGAVRSQNPVVASTWYASKMLSLPDLIVPLHAYTIIGFDPAKNMVTFRNPHGMHGDKFSNPDDPNHLDFEQLDDGVFKMSLPLMQKYFYQICRSFI